MATVSKKFVLNNVVISFVKIYEPVEKMNGKGNEYSIQVILSKDHAQTEEFKQLILGIGEEAFPGKPLAEGCRLIRDSDAEGKPEQYPYMENSYFFNLRRNEDQGKVPCAMPDGKLFEPNKQVIFSGCICNVHIGVYDYEIKGPGGKTVIKRGVTGSLDGIQLVDNVNVERLSGGASVPTFGVVENANVNAVLGDGHAVQEDEVVKPAETNIPW